MVVFPKGKKPKMKYVVERQVHSGTQRMFTTYEYKRALAYYNKHPRAFGIQKYLGEFTAGLIQPTVPNKLKIKGKVFERAYTGGHSKKNAQALVRGFGTQGNSAFIKKTKHGYQVFVHMRGMK